MLARNCVPSVQHHYRMIMPVGRQDCVLAESVNVNESFAGPASIATYCLKYCSGCSIWTTAFHPAAQLGGKSAKGLHPGHRYSLGLASKFPGSQFSPQHSPEYDVSLFPLSLSATDEQKQRVRRSPSSENLKPCSSCVSLTLQVRFSNSINFFRLINRRLAANSTAHNGEAARLL